jgi:hypothetical protein
MAPAQLTLSQIDAATNRAPTYHRGWVALDGLERVLQGSVADGSVAARRRDDWRSDPHRRERGGPRPEGEPVFDTSRVSQTGPVEEQAL